MKPTARRSVLGWLACLGLALLYVTSARAEQTPVAVFNFELWDTSLEGEVSGANSAETERLGMISDLLREKLADSGRYEIVDTAAAREAIEEAGYLRSCNGCDAKIAAGLGAEQSLTGVVQKVSNLILNINLYLRDVKSGELLKVMSADIRGNTDESWAHGVSWLVRNRILK